MRDKVNSCVQGFNSKPYSGQVESSIRAAYGSAVEAEQAGQGNAPRGRRAAEQGKMDQGRVE